MPESATTDPTDAGTLRPIAPPLQKKGSKFQPLDCPDFDIELCIPEDVSLDDPISLFTQYYTPEIIQGIVESTNSYVKLGKDKKPLKWTPTTAKEIYLYFAFLIYMTIVPMNKIRDYWSTRPITPFHKITKVFSRDRFIDLRTRFRVASNDIEDTYEKVEIAITSSNQKQLS
jgi:hypothetical protein